MMLRVCGVSILGLGVLGVMSLGACGSQSRDFVDTSEAGTFPAGPDGCSGFDCSPNGSCQGGAKTRLTGTAYDPAGKVPLYNAMVYVPGKAIEPIAPGASCDRCGGSAIGPRASALSDSKGNFVLELDGPVKDLPLVVQVGKWRRQVTLPTLKACETNALPADVTRLPRSQAEGDLPRMAIATGPCDPLQCLLRRMGVDDSEFTDELGKGRVHLFQGTLGGKAKNGSSFTTGLWSSVDQLKRYDAVLLACECEVYPNTKSTAARQALHDYASLGGRVFGTHYQYFWLQSGPSDFQGAATWAPDRATPISGSYAVDVSFPKGKAFAEWLVNVNASPSLGHIGLDQVKGDVLAVSAKSQRWIYDETPESAKYFSFNTPLDQPAESQCGRVTFSDIHVASGDDTGNKEFPDGCEARDLNAQEKALEFFLFDLAACVQPDSQTPTPIR